MPESDVRSVERRKWKAVMEREKGRAEGKKGGQDCRMKEVEG